MKQTLLLSPRDEALLVHLATYRFLTIQQAVRLGVGNRTHVGERFKRFLNAGIVDKLENSPWAGPSVYWLTKRGADEAAEFLPEGQIPQFLNRTLRGGPHSRQRVAIVDCHIALRQWAAEAGFSVDWFKAEFERNPGVLTPPTRTTWDGHNYTPDGLAQITGPDGTPWLFALEVETGGENSSLDNHRSKLPERLRVMENYEVEKALQWRQRKRLRLLFVFADETMFEKAKRILPSREAKAWRSIFFKSLPAVSADFGGEWWQSSGQMLQPFHQSIAGF